MRLRSKVAGPLSVALAAALAFACNSADLAGGGKKSTGKGKAAKDEAGEGEEEENSPTDEPQMVAGAFLTCGDAAEGVIGCAFQSSKKAKISGDVTDPSVTVAMTDSTSITPQATAVSDATSPWHLTFPLTAAQKATFKSAKVKATVAGTDYQGTTAALDGSAQAAYGGPSNTAADDGKHHVLFLSSAVYYPNKSDGFESADDADKRCQALGDAFAGGATWHAIIGTKDKAPRDRAPAPSKVINPAGTLLAEPGKLYAAPIKATPNVTEKKQAETDNTKVWTGANEDGTSNDDTCGDWGENVDPLDFTDNVSATVGSADKLDKWLNDSDDGTDCVSPIGATLSLYDKGHLYCLSSQLDD